MAQVGRVEPASRPNAAAAPTKTVAPTRHSADRAATRFGEHLQNARSSAPSLSNAKPSAERGPAPGQIIPPIPSSAWEGRTRLDVQALNDAHARPAAFQGTSLTDAESQATMHIKAELGLSNSKQQQAAIIRNRLVTDASWGADEYRSIIGQVAPGY